MPEGERDKARQRSESKREIEDRGKLECPKRMTPETAEDDPVPPRSENRGFSEMGGPTWQCPGSSKKAISVEVTLSQSKVI